jgi:hypothetical protein
MMYLIKIQNDLERFLVQRELFSFGYRWNTFDAQGHVFLDRKNFQRREHIRVNDNKTLQLWFPMNERILTYKEFHALDKD